jgi:hypothetical protein
MAVCGPPIKHPVLAANNTPGPPTGIAACSARAPRAATLPRSDSNSRRFNHSGTSRRKALVTLRLREIRE